MIYIRAGNLERKKKTRTSNTYDDLRLIYYLTRRVLGTGLSSLISHLTSLITRPSSLITHSSAAFVSVNFKVIWQSFKVFPSESFVINYPAD